MIVLLKTDVFIRFFVRVLREKFFLTLLCVIEITSGADTTFRSNLDAKSINVRYLWFGHVLVYSKYIFTRQM